MGDDLVDAVTEYLRPVAFANGIDGSHRPLADAVVIALRAFLTDDGIATIFSSALYEREAIAPLSK